MRQRISDMAHDAEVALGVYKIPAEFDVDGAMALRFKVCPHSKCQQPYEAARWEYRITESLFFIVFDHADGEHHAILLAAWGLLPETAKVR
jgi:hypothetical protein